MNSRQKFSHSVLHGLIWSYLSAGLYSLLQLGTIVVLSRMLSPYEFGLSGLGLIFVSFAERFGHAGLGQALVQRSSLTTEELNAGFTLSFIAGLLLTIILLVCAQFVAIAFGEPAVLPVLYVLSLIFVIDGLIVVPDALLQRELQFKRLALIENTSYFLGIACIGVSFALAGFGVWSLVFGQIGMRLVKVILFFLTIPHTCSFFWDLATFRNLLTTAFGFGFGRIFGFVALYADNLLIGKFLGTTSLGIYSRAYQLMSLPATLVGQIADRVLFPAFSKKQKDLDVLRSGLLLFVEVLSVVSLPVSVGFYLASPEIVLLLLGSGWEEAAAVLQVLSYGIFFRTTYKAGDTVSRAVGRVYAHAWVHVLYAFAVVIGAAVGSFYGLVGVAYGVLIAVAVNYFAMSHLALQSVKGNWPDFLRAHINGVVVALTFALAALGTLPWLRDRHCSSLLILIALAAVFICALPISWILISSSSRQRISNILTQLRGKRTSPLIEL